MSSTKCSRRSRRRLAMATAAGLAASAATSLLISTAASASASSASGTPACTSSSLRVTKGASQGTAGSVYTDIVYTNISRHTCHLYGYPGESLLTASGRQIGAAATHPVNVFLRLVTLTPGARARTTLRVVDAGNYPPSTCRPVPSAWLRVYPPNTTRPTLLRYRSTGCANPAVKLLSTTGL